jgi:DNA-binding GntR family transcriptional regulator
MLQCVEAASAVLQGLASRGLQSRLIESQLDGRLPSPVGPLPSDDAVNILNSEFGVDAMQPLPPRAQLIDQVYQRLLDAICRRALAPGERIGQEQLAELLGVSRQPVSHALQILKQQGFVCDAGRRGLIVAPVDADYLRALYDVRAALDGVAAGEAARRVQAGGADPETARLIVRGRAILAEGKAAGAAGERIALAEADVAFHDLINTLSGNPVILEISRQQWGHIRRAIDVVLDDPDVRRRLWDEHEAILEAVVRGDAEAAKRLARDHARSAGEQTWQRLAGLPKEPQEGAAA